VSPLASAPVGLPTRKNSRSFVTGSPANGLTGSRFSLHPHRNPVHHRIVRRHVDQVAGREQVVVGAGAAGGNREAGMPESGRARLAYAVLDGGKVRYELADVSP
jgi:hypothetical protein